MELEYHLLLAHDLQFLDDSGYHRMNDEVAEVRKMLISFIKKLQEEK
jgi:four helix bundle protein